MRRVHPWTARVEDNRCSCIVKRNHQVAGRQRLADESAEKPILALGLARCVGVARPPNVVERNNSACCIAEARAEKAVSLKHGVEGEFAKFGSVRRESSQRPGRLMR
jgi:hypothetical protein